MKQINSIQITCLGANDKRKKIIEKLVFLFYFVIRNLSLSSSALSIFVFDFRSMIISSELMRLRNGHAKILFHVEMTDCVISEKQNMTLKHHGIDSSTARVMLRSKLTN